MQKLLIVNVGRAPDPQREKYGDFELWAKKAIGDISHYPNLEIIFHDGIHDSLSDVSDISGVIIMGSLAMASEKSHWMLRLSDEIVDLVEARLPLLGICFGHQLIAQALGGKVGYHPKGLEIGSIKVNKHRNSASDPLFSQLPEQFLAHAVHYQSVLTLPPEATLLASNDFEPHHAYRVGQCAWGVQFHPEFTPEIMKMSLTGLKHDISNGYEEKLHEVSQCSDSTSLLSRFVEYCMEES